MGLDQYAYVAMKAGAREEFYNAEYSKDESKHGSVSEPRDLAYWRKHPNLQGWMANLWQKKSEQFNVSKAAIDNNFNGVELELTWEDLTELENVVRHNQLPETDGFFFGNNKDSVYYEDDLKFCIDAKAEIFLGFKVFYNSSW